MTALKRAWLPAFLCAYAAALVFLSRGITLEYGSGLSGMMSALREFGASGAGFGVDARQPPLLWVVLSPVTAWAYASGGAARAIAAGHAVMPLLLAAALWGCHAFFARLFSKATAALLTVLLAFDPLVIKSAVFITPGLASCLGALLFLAAARRYLDAPSPRRYGALLAGAVLAALGSYELLLLTAAPLAFLLIEPGLPAAARAKKLLSSPLWLLPPLCAALCVAFSGLTILLSGDRPAGVLADSYHQLKDLAGALLGGPAGYGWTFYPALLVRELGGALSAAALLGAAAWLAGRDRERRLYAAALLAPLALKLLALKNASAASLLAFAPLLYAAAGEGIETLLARLPAGPRRERPRWALLAFFLLMAPWRESARSARFLAREPWLRSPAPAALAARAEAALPETGCVLWLPGALLFSERSEVIAPGDPLPMAGPSSLRFFLKRGLRELRQEEDDGACRPALLVEPRWLGGDAGRWPAGGPLAKVYALAGSPRAEKTLSFELFEDGLRAP